MDALVIVDTLPPQVLQAANIYRMMELKSQIDAQAVREASSMFVLRQSSSNITDELQRQAARSDADNLMAVVNLCAAIAQHHEQVETSLMEWRKLHPKLFRDRG